mgnify:CR=1 FL=1
MQNLKSNIDECISHVIGAATPSSSSPTFHHNSRSPLDHYPRSRGSSPSARARTPTYKTSRSQPDIAIAAATVTAQRTLSAQNSQSADSPGDCGEETVDGTIVESILIPSKGI